VILRFEKGPKKKQNCLRDNHNKAKIKALADCEVRTHASFDNGDLSKLKTIALDPGTS
jgi:hypothetical protein